MVIFYSYVKLPEDIYAVLFFSPHASLLKSISLPMFACRLGWHLASFKMNSHMLLKLSQEMT